MTNLRMIWNGFYRGWMRFAHVLGVVNTTILLSIVYLIVVLPTRLIWWVIRKDPLMIHRTSGTPRWLARVQDEPTIDERRHPF